MLLRFSGAKVVGTKVGFCWAMVSIFPDDAMNPLSATSLQESRPALRRATYVHVSDLTSAYNIDHAKLEQEIARVNAERVSTTETIEENLSESDVDPSDTTAELDVATTASPQKRLQPPRGGYNLCVYVLFPFYVWLCSTSSRRYHPL